MINLGASSLIHWKDDWTATTRDGKRSAQFEETILCVLPSECCSAFLTADGALPARQHHGQRSRDPDRPSGLEEQAQEEQEKGGAVSGGRPLSSRSRMAHAGIVWDV